MIKVRCWADFEIDEIEEFESLEELERLIKENSGDGEEPVEIKKAGNVWTIEVDGVEVGGCEIL